MELCIFARFHARPGQEEGVAAAIREVIPPSTQEPGCLSMRAFRSTRDPRSFYIHARWVDEAAADRHVEQPHAVRFLGRVLPLIDHEMDATRARPLDQEAASLTSGD